MTSTAHKLPTPGLLWGAYPERRGKKHSSKKQAFAWVLTLLDRVETLEKNKAQRFVAQMHLQEAAIQALDAVQFKLELQKLQMALRRDGFTNSLLSRAFALLNQVFTRALAVQLYDPQIIAAHHILNNRLAEMATGEGKTYAVALAAATAALAGMPVHVITANDYLAQRDADLLRVFYSALGISVDAAVHGQETGRRQAAYACDVTYCTAKELVFDYLRDGLFRSHDPLRRSAEQISGATTQPLLLRGLCMAIVDEADSILIDEARVPLILSRGAENGQEQQYIDQSLDLARGLIEGDDYRLDKNAMRAILTQNGREKLEVETFELAPVWHNRLHREEAVSQALAGLYIYQRDRHYLVQEGEVQIIDETTGRIAHGRSWSRGLHQVIELKEGCKTSATLTTVSQITYQRFFPRYLRLGGVSGTLLESRSELFKVYGLRVSRVPLRKSSKRTLLPCRLFESHADLWDALATRIVELQHTGRPVLIGTESVADSESLSHKLLEANVQHMVLNARHDKKEAEMIAKAGHAGVVTVTTNMAGRGTDIALANGVEERGGLHIISCQVNTSRRIDRQLAGRCARQGNAGSVETWVSLQTALLQQRLPQWLKNAVKKYVKILPNSLIRQTMVLVQLREERHHELLRKRLLVADKALEQNLTFGASYD